MEELIYKRNMFEWTSLDIENWTEKRHDNIMRDIKNEIDNLIKGGMEKFAILNFEEGTFINRNNQSFPMYNLTKMGVQQLCMRYDAIVRAKVNLKLEELANKPLSRLDILKAALKAEEEKLLIEKRNTQLENTFAKIEDNLPHQGEYTAQQMAQRFGIFSESGLPHAAVINYLLRDLDQNYDYQRSKKVFALYQGQFFREVYTCAPTGTRYKELMYNQKAYDYIKYNYDIILKQNAKRTKSGLRILGQKRKLYYTLFDDNF